MIQSKNNNKILQMSRSAKESWFESPLSKRGFWFLQQEKNEIFNLSKTPARDKALFITPSRSSKPMQIQKLRNTSFNHTSQCSQGENNRFQDVNLADMFLNTKIQKQVVSSKIDFQDSCVAQDQQDFKTPQHYPIMQEQSHSKCKRYQHQTTAKKSNLHYLQQKTPRPKQKGLRMLSQKAYGIVLKLKGATYKQVANVLVDELAAQDCIDIDGRDQQNIKRRVYDALNVLIALGVLTKEGRKICGIERNNFDVQTKMDQVQRLKEQTRVKEFRILHKIKQYKNTITRSQMIKALIRRNSSKIQSANKIQFPFIALSLSQQDEKKVFVKNQRVEIYSSQMMPEPFGDLDAISFLRPSLKTYIQ